MHVLEQQFEQTLLTLTGPVKHQKLLVAVSGGADSVVLAHLCHRLKITFGIAHCNFGLRGAESQRDQDFVQNLAQQMQVPFYLSAFNTTDYAVQHSLGIQEAARQLRYNWFNTLLKTEAYSYVLTAHHANDNVETVLMHLFRGSGIKGLRGMLPKQGQVLRPLLHASRAQIEAYAAQLQLSWVEDSSNATDHYTRNLVRHKVVDAMIEVYPKAMENFNHSVHLLRQAAGVYSTTVETLLKKLVVIKAEEHHLPILLLKKMPEPEAILYEWLQPHGFLASQMAQAWQLLDAQSGTTLLSPTHRIIKHRAWIILAPLAPMQSQHLVINNFDSPILFQSQQLLGRFQTGNDTSILPNKNMAFFDAAAVPFPLLLRPWQPGDYFYPLGMQKKKKVARFLIDAKLSKTAKEQVWVLESNKRIVWVVGMRIDNRCQLRPHAKQCLVLELKPV